MVTLFQLWQVAGDSNEGREVEVGSAPDEGDHDTAILESSEDKDSDVDRIQEPKQVQCH